MNHKLFKLMEKVVLVNKQIIIRFTTVVHNLATFPGQITSCNTQIEIYWRKGPKIEQLIFDSWLLKANLECPIRFFVHFSKTLNHIRTFLLCYHELITIQMKFLLNIHIEIRAQSIQKKHWKPIFNI